MAKGADSWDRLRVSGGVLDVFRWGLVGEIPRFKEIWEAARRVHYEAMVDIFGAAFVLAFASGSPGGLATAFVLAFASGSFFFWTSVF